MTTKIVLNPLQIFGIMGLLRIFQISPAGTMEIWNFIFSVIFVMFVIGPYRTTLEKKKKCTS